MVENFQIFNYVKKTLLIVTNLNAVIWTLFIVAYFIKLCITNQHEQKWTEIKVHLSLELIAALVVLVLLMLICSTIEVYGIYRENLLVVIIFACIRFVGSVTFAINQHFPMFIIYFIISCLYGYFIYLLKTRQSQLPTIVVYHVT